MTPEELLAESTLEVLSVRRRSHVVVRVRNQHGVEISLTFPFSPSDSRRGWKNQRALIRRFERCTSYEEYRPR